MNKVVKVLVERISVNDVLAEKILDNGGNLLINQNTVLTERHISFLKESNVEFVSLNVHEVVSNAELEQIKIEYLTSLKKKFRYFEEGKKKNTLMKLFFKYKLRQFSE